MDVGITLATLGNIRASLIGKDLTEIDPALLMAAMQLSLAEAIVLS